MWPIQVDQFSKENYIIAFTLTLLFDLSSPSHKFFTKPSILKHKWPSQALQYLIISYENNVTIIPVRPCSCLIHLLETQHIGEQLWHLSLYIRSALYIRIDTACRFIECALGYVTPKCCIVSVLRSRAGRGRRNARHGVDRVSSNKFWLINNDTIKRHKLLIINLQDISKFGKLN